LEKSGFEGGRVFFSLGGADANEHAVKFARQAGAKPKGWIITRDRSYHGATFGAMALSGDTRTRHHIEPQDLRVVHVPPPYAYRCPFGSTSESECGERSARHVGEVIDEHGSGEVAAVLMEPDAGTNGIVAPDNYWPLLREETRDRGVYLIADEVMSGFGRCGEWFAWQRYGEDCRPDLMSLAKGLTASHLPLGAVVISRDIAARLENEMLYTGLTYCGHPLACAVGLAALEAYEDERLIERSRALGARLFAELCAMRDRVEVIGEVRGGHGLFAIVELVRDRATRDPISPWPESHPSLKTLVDRSREQGVSFATHGNLIVLAPPLVIEEKDLMDALALMERLLTELEWS
jgi:taurine--2-oxoglutarate transaminase